MATEWRKSTKSDNSTGGGNCVELARLPGLVGIRDSKSTIGPHLGVSRAAFGLLVDRIKASELDR